MLPKDLLTAAVLGTQTNQIADSPMLSSMMIEHANEQSEHHVLQVAGSLSLQRRAGWIPSKTLHPLPPPSEIDERPPISPIAMMHLQMMQKGTFKRALPEWLREIAASGKRVPAEAVVMMLELGRKNNKLRQLMIPILGERGKWLAEQTQSRDWYWLNIQNIDEIWKTATQAMREEIINALRKINPDEAYRLVESVWDSETADMRYRYLNAFHEGLGANDLPLLERALSDYNKVRKEASMLLSKIPVSTHIRQIVNYAKPFLYLDVRNGDLVVQMDENRKIDAAAPRGVSFTHYISGPISLGLMLSHVPPQAWLRHFDLTPDAFLKAVNRNQRYANFLLEALIMAAFRFRDHVFADVLIDHTYNLSEQIRNPLYIAVSRARLEQLAIKRLNQRSSLFSSNHPAVAFLYLLDAPWSQQLSKALVSCLERGIEVRDNVDGLFMRFAIHIPIDLRDAFMKAINKQLHYNDTHDALEQILDFRTEMLDAIYHD